MDQTEIRIMEPLEISLKRASRSFFKSCLHQALKGGRWNPLAWHHSLPTQEECWPKRMKAKGEGGVNRAFPQVPAWITNPKSVKSDYGYILLLPMTYRLHEGLTCNRVGIIVPSLLCNIKYFGNNSSSPTRQFAKRRERKKEKIRVCPEPLCATLSFWINWLLEKSDLWATHPFLISQVFTTVNCFLCIFTCFSNVWRWKLTAQCDGGIVSLPSSIWFTRSWAFSALEVPCLEDLARLAFGLLREIRQKWYEGMFKLK